MNPKLDAEAIYGRLREWLGLPSDTALAEFLGASPQSLYNWKKAGSVQLEKIIEKCPNLDMDWLLLGRGKPGKAPKDGPKDRKRKAGK